MLARLCRFPGATFRCVPSLLPEALREVRTGVVALFGEVHVPATGAVASFVAFALGVSDGRRLVERAAVVYVDADDGGVRDVDHEWHERIESTAGGGRSWLPVAVGGLDELRLVGAGPAVSWVRTAPAPVWLGEGDGVWHGTGGRVGGFDALPADVRAFVEAERPEFAFPPVLDVTAAVDGLPGRGLRAAGRGRSRFRR